MAAVRTRQTGEGPQEGPGVSKEDASMNQITGYTPAVFYSRVSSDR